MKQCSKEVEIELSDGTVVETTLKVIGVFDEEFNADENKDVPGAWLVESWTTDHDDDLGDDEQEEFDEKIEEIVFSEKWDWDNAPYDEDELGEDEQ